MRKNLFFLAALCLFVSLSAASSIGVSPGFINLGEIEPGDSEEVTFYVTTNFDDEFVIGPEYSKTLRFAGFNSSISMNDVSEQDIGAWIDFSEDTYIVDSNSSESYQLSDGSTVNAEGAFSFEINVPPNAEPGYRMGTIDLDPEVYDSGSGAGANLMAQTIPGFAFRVPGAVDRQIELVDIRAIRIGENEVQIIKQIRNSGTTTTSLTGGEIDILDENGEKIDDLRLNDATLEPGEHAEIERVWMSGEIEGGDYSVEGTGDYRTGEMYVSGDFVLTEVVQERATVDEPSGGEAEELDDVPVTLIVMFMVVMGVLLYLLEVDTLWTIVIAGATGMGLFILLSAASNYLILMAGIAMMGILYYA